MQRDVPPGQAHVSQVSDIRFAPAVHDRQSLRHQFVVVAYGQSPYLSACLASIAACRGDSKIAITTSTPSEYLFEAAATFGFPVLVREGEPGIANDWNFALDSATEPVVTLAHQDDIYYTDFAITMQELFRDNPNACLAFTDYDQIDAAGARMADGLMMIVKRLLRTMAIGHRAVVTSRCRRRALLSFGSTIPCPSVSINRAAVPDFRFSKGYRINLDWDAWWRLHDGPHAFVRSRRALMGHRVHPGAETSRGKGDGTRQAEDLAMFQRIWPWPISALLAGIYKCGY